MCEGLVRIAAYPGEFMAMDAKQALADNGIEAEVFTGGLIAQLPQYDLFVRAEKSDEALEILKEFEAEMGRAADDQAEGENEHPEADCEGSGE
jgi:hypothetical protein